MTTLQDLIDSGLSGTYDFAFIDANKADYPNYYNLCVQLLRPGGVIAVDNVSNEYCMVLELELSGKAIDFCVTGPITLYAIHIG